MRWAATTVDNLVERMVVLTVGKKAGQTVGYWVESLVVSTVVTKVEHWAVWTDLC